jgi:hypothetical protein
VDLDVIVVIEGVVGSEGGFGEAGALGDRVELQQVSSRASILPSGQAFGPSDSALAGRDGFP